MFRLKSMVIALPPLRDRRGDIREIAFHCVDKFSRRYGTDIKGFSPEFLDALNQYDWPGNVRELVNTLDRALATTINEPTLFVGHLPTHIRIRAARASLGDRPEVQGEVNGHTRGPALLPTLREFRRHAFRELERHYLQDLIRLAKRDIRETCRISGLSRSRLYGLLKEHHISRPD